MEIRLFFETVCILPVLDREEFSPTRTSGRVYNKGAVIDDTLGEETVD
jgi:hypothetical protein